jgi:tripartite-type tricarboxylate transporter receptor subunit TctC
VPKGTRKEIIAKLNAAAVEAMANPAAKNRMDALALEIPPREQKSAQALGALQKTGIGKWWPIIKAAHITGG